MLEKNVKNEEIEEFLRLYMKLGFVVLPAVYGDKKPIVKWKKYQQKGPSKKETEKWFKTETQQNVAILCGASSGNLVVLDFDDKSVYPKFFNIEEIEKKTLVVKTGSGKHHVYLRTKKPIASFKIPRIRLEVRSEGNIVIAPPSKHPSGGHYEIVGAQEVLEVDDLETSIWKKAAELGIKSPEKLLTAATVKRGYGEAYEGPDPPCIITLLKGVKEGIRNEAAMRLLSYWIKFRKEIGSKEKALLRLKKWNRLNQPPLSEDELKTIVASVKKLEFSYGCRTNQAWCNIETCTLVRNRRLNEDAGKEAEGILNSNDVLGALMPHLDNLLAGEEDNKKLAFVLLISGKSKDPSMKQILVVKGEPGAGKSHLLKLCDVFRTKSVGRFSAHALDYTNMNDFEILRLKELGGMDQEFQGVSTIKFLSSDDKGYTIETTEQDKGRFITKTRKIAPITVATSTTRVQLDPQFMRRAWPLNPDESKEQTERVRKWKANLERENNFVALGLKKETSYDQSLRVLRAVVEKMEAIDVLLTFPDALTQILGVEKLRLRGDYGKFLSFVKLHAFLHQRTLPRICGVDAHEAILATPDKAFEALRIAEDAYVSMTSELEGRTRRVLTTLEELNIREQGAIVGLEDRTKIAVRLGLSEKTVRRYLSEWVTAGYMAVKEIKGRGRPHVFQLVYSLDKIKKKTCVSLDISRITEEKRLKFQKEAEFFLDSLGTKISYVDGWTEEKVRQALNISAIYLHLEQSVPFPDTVQKENGLPEWLYSQNKALSVENSPKDKIDTFFPICFICNKPVVNLRNLSNLEGKTGHKQCIEKLRAGRNSHK